MVFHQLLLIIPHLGIYPRHCGKTLIFFTQMQSLEQLLRQVYRSARNLKSFLVWSKVYPLERTTGSSKCGSKRCQVYLNVSETDSFESFQTKRQYKVNYHHDCNDKCLIYLPSCKICGLQYVSSSTDRFRLRWNKYKDNDRTAQRGEEYRQPELFEHFLFRET